MERGTIADLTSPDEPRRRVAFEAVFSEMAPLVSRIAWHILGDRGRAEDVAQETFLQVWRHAGKWRGEGTLEAWILTIATNLCRRTLVRDARRRRAMASHPPASAQVATESASATERDDIARRIQDSLARLSPEQRVAVTLSCVQGLSGREIARILGCKEGTVWSRVWHAKRRLASLLGGLDEDHQP